jgi:hypothetical protein
MRWTLKQSDPRLNYWEFEANETTGHLKYNKQAHSFRISAGDKRLFFLERTGFLHHRYLLRTEYSVIAGEIYPAKNGYMGIAFIEGKKFRYELNNDVLTLSFKKTGKTFSVGFGNSLNPDQYEFCALLSATFRMVSTVYMDQPEPALFNKLTLAPVPG